ncbi:hypothetical protein K8353_30505 [Burkholderia contaminans]|nr:hypothetical protein [Burkholderia contaminans]
MSRIALERHAAGTPGPGTAHCFAFIVSPRWAGNAFNPVEGAMKEHDTRVTSDFEEMAEPGRRRFTAARTRAAQSSDRRAAVGPGRSSA